MPMRGSVSATYIIRLKMPVRESARAIKV